MIVNISSFVLGRKSDSSDLIEMSFNEEWTWRVNWSKYYHNWWIMRQWNNRAGRVLITWLRDRWTTETTLQGQLVSGTQRPHRWRGLGIVRSRAAIWAFESYCLVDRSGYGSLKIWIVVHHFLSFLFLQICDWFDSGNICHYSAGRWEEALTGSYATVYGC